MNSVKCSTQAPRYWQPYCKQWESRGPLAGWPLNRGLCVLSDSDKAASFSAHSPAYWLLPATLSDMLWVFLCLLGAGAVALSGVIHKVLHLFGAKSMNCTQNRIDSVFCASLMAVWEEEILVYRNELENNPLVSILNPGVTTENINMYFVAVTYHLFSQFLLNIDWNICSGTTQRTKRNRAAVYIQHKK